MLRLLSKCCTFSKFRFLFFHVKRNLQHSNCFIQPPFLGPAAIATSTALTRSLPNPPQFVQSSLMPAQGKSRREFMYSLTYRSHFDRIFLRSTSRPPIHPTN